MIYEYIHLLESRAMTPTWVSKGYQWYTYSHFHSTLYSLVRLSAFSDPLNTCMLSSVSYLKSALGITSRTSSTSVCFVSSLFLTL